jgi:hypothetical protein
MRDIIWKGILIWFILVMAILSIAREWSVVIFGMTYGLGFGGIAYRYRKSVKKIFDMHANNYLGFLLLCIVITVSEEVYCYLLGNQIAHPVLAVDLFLVCTMWTVWFGTWYFYISRRYIFEEKEALLTAGVTGVFYEYVGTGTILENPVGIILAIPLAVVVYAAIFVLPLQLITFTGKKTGKTKYIVGSVLPFVLTIPVAVLIYVVLTLIYV